MQLSFAELTAGTRKANSARAHFLLAFRHLLNLDKPLPWTSPRPRSPRPPLTAPRLTPPRAMTTKTQTYQSSRSRTLPANTSRRRKHEGKAVNPKHASPAHPNPTRAFSAPHRRVSSRRRAPPNAQTAVWTTRPPSRRHPCRCPPKRTPRWGFSQRTKAAMTPT